MADEPFLQRVGEDFGARYAVYWANLARLTNLLIVMNISFFFVSGLVTTHGYYYTYFSLLLTGVVYLALLVPVEPTGWATISCSWLSRWGLCISLWSASGTGSRPTKGWSS